MSKPMNISDEAVEAAREAVRAAMIEFGPDGHTDGDEEITRAALEAAAPYLMAELAEPGSAMREAMRIAWERGREDGYHHRPNPYRSEEND